MHNGYRIAVLEGFQSHIGAIRIEYLIDMMLEEHALFQSHIGAIRIEEERIMALVPKISIPHWCN